MEFCSLSGRATRSEWWLTRLLGFVLAMVYAFAASYFAKEIGIYEKYGLWTLIAIVATTVLVYEWETFSASIRRLHDRGRSGWFLLVYWLLSAIPLIGTIVWIIYIIDLGFTDGVVGPNQYGDDPKKRRSPFQSEPIVVNVTQNANGTVDVKSEVVRFCFKCGTKIEPNSKFCSKCGEPVK